MQRKSSSNPAEKWLNIAKSLINKGADVNATDDWKQTPLHLVDSVEMADLFVKHDANVNALDNIGRTPLHTVSNTEVAQLLVNSGADMQVKDVQGKMPIFQHLEKSHAEIVRILIDNGAGINSKDEIIRHMKSTEAADKNQNEMRKILQDCAPATVDSLKRAIESMSLETIKLMINNQNVKPKVLSRCLCVAAKHGKIKIVEYFIKSGADVNSQYEGKNVLEWAISSGCMKVVEILINAGAEINAKNQNGKTSLFQCVLKSRTKILRFLIDKGANVNATDKDEYTPIHWARSKEIAEILIENGAKINVAGRYQRTPLFQYVLESRTEMVHFLVDKGAGVNSRDVHRNMPLHYARNREITEILLGKGADINAVGERKKTLLLTCVERSLIEMVKFLIGKGADVNHRDEEGNTPIHYAKSKEIAELLINAGADIDALGKHNRTPLFQCVLESRTETVRFLIEKGVNTNATDEDDYTPIYFAKDREIAEILIENGAEINVAGRYQRTPLFQYVIESQIEMVQFLVGKEVDVNLRDEYCNTPIHYARSREIAEILLGKGADINAVGERKKTPLLTCVERSLIEMVKFLVEKGANVNIGDKNGKAPIHYAKKKEIIEILINAGADVNVKDKYGITPLIQSVIESNAKVVQFLVDKGVDVNAGDKDGYAPIHHANDKEIMSILTNAGADVNVKGQYGGTSLIQSIRESNADMVHFLVDKGVDVNARDKDGYAPIHHANGKEIMSILTNAGADVNVKDIYGITPLIQSVIKSNAKVVQFLVDIGADVNVRDKYENAPIQYANDKEIMRILTNAGADVNVKDRYGRTPLIQSVIESNAKVVQFLVDIGVDVNAGDKDGYAPIHHANDKEIMSILTNAGADVNVKDRYGRTPLIQSVRESNMEIVQFLVDKGVDVNARDEDGYTSIHYANDKEVMRILINAGADVNVEKISKETPQIRRTSESQKLLLQSPENKGADEVASDIDPGVRVHHTESTEIAGSNSGRSTSANIKHESSVSAIEILPLASEILPLATEVRTVVGIIQEKHRHAQRYKVQCQKLTESIVDINDLLKSFYATLKERRDKDEDLVKLLKKFLIITRDAQDIINKHCNVSFLEKVFLKNRFENEFKSMNQRLSDIKDAFSVVIDVKIAEAIDEITVGMSDMDLVVLVASEDVRDAIEEANKGVKVAIKEVQKAKKSEVLEIPTIENSEIMLDEQSRSTSKITGMLKKLQPIELIENEEIVKDKQKLEIMWKLSSCEGILTLYGLYEYNNKQYMVTERPNVDCPTLDLIIERKKFFQNWGVIRSMSLELANAIEFMHRCEILHKAICSSNICIVSDRYVRIFGFESARYISSGTNNLTGPHDQIRWTAPERLKAPRHDYDEKCDIYSLGVVMWSLATHEVPFDKLTPREILTAKLDIPEDILKEFAVIIEGCIDRDREKRWSIDRVNDELSKLVPENLESNS